VRGGGHALALAAVLATALAAAGGAPAAGAAAPAAPAPAPDAQAVLILVRSALAALDQADKTGNYTVLRDLGGPVFQKNTAARLSEVFASLRTPPVDLSPALAVQPVYTLPPRIEATGLLRAAGFVPAGSQRLNFEIAWQRGDGGWRLYGVVVTATEAGPGR
jgi:hypothetical protein